MNQYLDFFITHWEYSLLFIAAFIWIILAECNDQKVKRWGVQASQAVDLINRQSALVFDLRNATDFEQGHIVGAKRVDFKAIDEPSVLKIKPQTVCLFVCHLGQTSSKVVNALHAKGYLSTYTLNGGMTNWQKENLPIVTGK